MFSDGCRHLATSLVIALVALLVLAAAAPLARADGDPASDVLAVQKLFLPADAGIPARQQLQLEALLNESARKGYPLRVAIVGSSIDLGSVSALWRRPEAYAHFLGSELTLLYHGTVLVVMPNGYGSDVTAPVARTATGETQLPLPAGHLGSAAITAVERFAASAGTPLTSPTVHLQTAPRAGSLLPWLVFALGFIPLILAWGASLRRQPLALRLRQH
jgi:hypothetical protein